MSEVNSLCRLCSTNVKRDGLSIFGDRGRRSYLQSKIKLYLHFSVAENDDLPKFLCISCFRKLENIHRFASMALCIQDRLRSRLGLQAFPNPDVPSPYTLLQSAQSAQSTQCAQSARSAQYLHTEQMEGKEVVESDYEVIEMEINPMTILYPGDENDSCTADEKPYELQENQESLQESNPLRSRLKNNLAFVPKKRGRKRKTENGEENKTETEARVQNQLELETEEKSKTETGIGEQDKMETETGESDNRETETEPNNKTKPKRTEGLENNLCGVCRKNFESQSKLEAHLIKHHVDGKFGCSICSRVFRSKESLEFHATNHNVRDYTCNECGRVYSTKSTLNSHLVTHSDVRPHKCALCPKTFKRNQDLKFHLNQHTGERPYLCPFCPKAFASSGNCFSHRKRMHPQENEQIRAAPGVVKA